jgi:hypothetical protein
LGTFRGLLPLGVHAVQDQNPERILTTKESI